MFFDWRTIAVIFGALTLISCVLIAGTLPESPRWLMTFRPRDFEETNKSLRWIYRRYDVSSTCIFIGSMQRLFRVFHIQEVLISSAARLCLIAQMILHLWIESLFMVAIWNYEIMRFYCFSWRLQVLIWWPIPWANATIWRKGWFTKNSLSEHGDGRKCFEQFLGYKENRAYSTRLGQL